MSNFPFELKVLIYRRPHMRDEGLEYELYSGLNVLRQLFDEERVDENLTEVSFSFPERWLNIVEERSLFQRLAHFCPNLKKVTIKTQSVYIIQCTPRDCCLIVKSEEEQACQKLPQEATTGRLWFTTPGRLVSNPSKLSVISGL